MRNHKKRVKFALFYGYHVKVHYFTLICSEFNLETNAFDRNSISIGKEVKIVEFRLHQTPNNKYRIKMEHSDPHQVNKYHELWCIFRKQIECVM